MICMRLLAAIGSFLVASCVMAPATHGSYLETPGKVRIYTEPGDCVSPETEELSRNVKYEQLTIVQNGRARTNPRFLFNREPFGPNLAGRAQLAVGSLQMRIMDACSNWIRAGEAEKPAYWTQRNDLLIEVVHLAIRLEAASTVAEFEALLDEARLASNRRLEEDIRAGR